MAAGGDLKTVHLYYDDTEKFSCDSKVELLEEDIRNGKHTPSLVLDRTVMHPQGGLKSIALWDIVVTVSGACVYCWSLIFLFLFL